LKIGDLSILLEIGVETLIYCFFFTTVVNFVSTDDERLASLIQQYSETGDSLDKLFSRRRGLSRALRSRDNNVAM